MKFLRISFFWLILVILFGVCSFVSAYDLSDDDRKIVEQIVRDFANKQKNLDIEIQKTNLQNFSDKTSLVGDNNSSDIRVQAMIWYFKVLVDIKINELDDIDAVFDDIEEVKSDFVIDYGKYNIDIQKIRDTWLGRHNAERKLVGKKNLIYNLELERTAYTWAKFLWDYWQDRLVKKTRKHSTHRRKEWDGYYSYKSIKERFENQWVVFDWKEVWWQTLFHENVWRWYFTCKDSDCTDEVIKSIKTTRNMFMSEKKYKWAHYKWIIWNHKNVWVGVYIFGNRYIVVTHFGMDIQ